MTKRLTLKILTPMIAIAAAMAFGPAQAEPIDALSVTIDRDQLTSRSGVEGQLGRIEGRVKRFCNYREGLSLWEMRIERECVAENMAALVGQINNYRLSEAYKESEFYAGEFSPQG